MLLRRSGARLGRWSDSQIEQYGSVTSKRNSLLHTLGKCDAVRLLGMFVSNVDHCFKVRRMQSGRQHVIDNDRAYVKPRGLDVDVQASIGYTVCGGGRKSQAANTPPGWSFSRLC